ncbi:hypothetical protein [Clostridium botulinum]|uniref:hypothetical protein n=2 Tax=Clostridium botulinum TaxID=1491 RepID=UPI000774D14C|nr:hypothetical protein [Clostridium botulinum]
MVILEVLIKVTRNNTIMAFLKLEDLSESILVIVFPKKLEKFNLLINEDLLVVIRDRLSLKEGELPKIISEEIQPLEKFNSSKVYIRVQDNEKVRTVNKLLKTILETHKGNTPIYIFSEKERQSFRLSKDLWISLDVDIISTLRRYFWDENIKVVD